MLYPRIPGRVSVVVTNFNKGEFLEACLDGILAQSHSDWELILVDDCSTDSSASAQQRWLEDHAAQLEGHSVHALRLPRNIGYAGAVTVGMFLSQGEYIAMHDADDISHPERLARQTAYLRDHPEIELLGTNYSVFEKEEDRLVDKPSGSVWLAFGKKVRQVYLNGGHCVCHGTVMLRGELFDRLGGHTRRVKGAEDYDFIARCIRRDRDNVDNLREVLYYYRKHTGQRSREFFGSGRKMDDGHGG